MRVLITGARGFVGNHLSQHLTDSHSEIELHGTVFAQESTDTSLFHALHQVDLRDFAAVKSLIQAIQPDHIYHLAAQSSPRQSFREPWLTLENNIRSQLNIISACLDIKLTPRILLISSAEIYGADENPIDENAPFYPGSPYGVSKITQDMLGLQYYLSDGLPIIRVRPFNHTGPGQREGFVAPDFAMQIARIEAGQREPVMYVGRLDAQRDFTDVRDVVRAYQQVIELGQPGDVYNVASNKAYSIQYLLDTLLSFSKRPIEVRADPARMTKADASIKWGDISRIHAATGWQPEIPFEQTLKDLLEDCRQRVAASTDTA